MSNDQEKKNKRIALLSSITLHVGLFLLFFFMVAWKAPNPPLPEYGIELNFGTEAAGSGEIQPVDPVGASESLEEEAVQEEAESEQEPVEAPVETQPDVTSKIESPVEVKEEKEKPKPKPVEEKKEPQKPKEQPKAVYTPNNASQQASSKKGEPGSQGDDVNKKGDKGSPEGAIDDKAMFGKQGGGGGGSSLNLSGWVWDDKPDPQVPNNESGRLVFEIKVDQNGDIISIRTLERSVSPETERICRNEVQKLTFSKTGANVPEVSTGTITFLVRAQ